MKITEVNISKTYGDIQIDRGKDRRFYRYSARRETLLLPLLRFVGNFASSQVYSPKEN